MRLYTVHFRRFATRPERRLVLVKEGFSWPAFFLSGLWALWHRLWLVAALMFAGGLAVAGLGALFGLGPASAAALSLGYAAILGFVANDLRCWMLETQDYDFLGVASGANQDEAARRCLEAAPDITPVVLP